MIFAVLQSWITSLFIFLPWQFKNYLVNTFRALAQSYKILVHNFWWIVPVFLAILLLTPGKPSSVLYATLIIIYFVYVCVWIFLSILAARPAVEKKEMSYFKHYLGSFIYFLALGTATFFLIYFSLLIPGVVKGLRGLLLADLPVSFSATWFFFSCMFYVDSDHDALGSTKRGFAMALYNFPFCFIIMHVCYALAYVLYKIYVFIPAHISIFISWKLIKIFILVFFSFIFLTILFVPIIACLLSTFYSKRLQEQRALYFKN